MMILKCYHKETGLESVDSVHVAQERKIQ